MIEQLRLLVVPDHEVVRKGLRSVLDRQPGWQNARSVSANRVDPMRRNHSQPEITILNIGPSSSSANGEKQNSEKTAGRGKVLILTTHDSDPLVQAVLDAGARGFLLKSNAGDDIATAVEAVRRNNSLFTSSVGHELPLGKFDKTQFADLQEAPSMPLTPRQVEVLK